MCVFFNNVEIPSVVLRNLRQPWEMCYNNLYRQLPSWIVGSDQTRFWTSSSEGLLLWGAIGITDCQEITLLIAYNMQIVTMLVIKEMFRFFFVWQKEKKMWRSYRIHHMSEGHLGSICLYIFNLNKTSSGNSGFWPH